MLMSMFILGVTGGAYIIVYEVPFPEGINTLNASFIFILVSFYLFFVKYSVERTKEKMK